MKKTLFTALLAVMLVVLSACSADIPLQVSSPMDTSVESPNPPEASPAPETSNAPITPQGNPFETAGMPTPFEYEGGDGNEDFYDVHISKLYGSAIPEDFAEYLGVSSEDFYTLRAEKYGDFWSKLGKSSLLEMSNLLSVMIEYDIPNEVVLASINKHNEMNERFAIQFNDEEFLKRNFTETEIEALLSRDEAKVLEVFATDYAIVIGDRAYSPAWLYLNTPEDYAEAGITPEMVEEKLDLYGDLALTQDAISAFEDKLSAFTDESVTLEHKQAD